MTDEWLEYARHAEMKAGIHKAILDFLDRRVGTILDAEDINGTYYVKGVNENGKDDKGTTSGTQTGVRTLPHIPRRLISIGVGQQSRLEL